MDERECDQPITNLRTCPMSIRLNGPRAFVQLVPEPAWSEVSGTPAGGVARQRKARILPTPYFHLVITLPERRRRSPQKAHHLLRRTVLQGLTMTVSLPLVLMSGLPW